MQGYNRPFKICDMRKSCLKCPKMPQLILWYVLNNSKGGSKKGLTLILLVANFASTKLRKKGERMTETLAYGHSSDNSQRELSNEHQHDRFKMVFKNLCVVVLWMEVAFKHWKG